MQFLSLILSVVSIFIGGAKGCKVWLIGTAIILIISFGLVLSVGSFPKVNSHDTVLVVASIAITIVSIMISRWWGLLFNICATVVLFWVAMSGLI